MCFCLLIFFHCRSFLPWCPLDSLSASITFSGFSFNETRLFCILSLASALSLLSTSVLSPVQTDATLLGNNSQHCWMLHVPSFCTPCCMLLDVKLLRVVAKSLKPVKLLSQQLPTFLLFRDRRSVAQQCWIRLHSSSNIVEATHAQYAWFTKTYGLCPSHEAIQIPTLLGVVASVCTPLPIRT